MWLCRLRSNLGKSLELCCEQGSPAVLELVPGGMKLCLGSFRTAGQGGGGTLTAQIREAAPLPALPEAPALLQAFRAGVASASPFTPLLHGVAL